MKTCRFFVYSLLALWLLSALPPAIVRADDPPACTTWANGSSTTTHWQISAESRIGTEYVEDLTTLEVTSSAYQVDSFITSEVEVGSPTVTNFTTTNCDDYVMVYESYGSVCTIISSVDINEQSGYNWTSLGEPVPYGPITVNIDSGDPNLRAWREYSGVTNTATADKVATVGTQLTWQCTVPPEVEIPPEELPDPEPPIDTGGGSEPVLVTEELTDPIAPEASLVVFNQPDATLVFQTGMLLEIPDALWQDFLTNGIHALTQGGLTEVYSTPGGFGTNGYFNATVPESIVTTTRFVVVASRSDEVGEQTIVAVFEEQVLIDGTHQTVWYYNTGAAASH
jgi:hypothetical protein